MLLLSIIVLFIGHAIAISTVHDHNKVVICYISTWAVYRKGAASYTIEHFDPKLCTHAIYAFAGLDIEKDAIKSLDPWQDLKEEYGKGGYERLVELKKTNPHLKVLLAIGGWNEGSERYSNLASDPARREKFVKQSAAFIKTYGFDGLDLDWEYPTKRGGKPEDRENFVSLVKELNQEYKKDNLLLTSAFGAGKDTIDSAYDIKELSKFLDFLHIMCYDYKGSWDKKIGANAPLTSKDLLNVEVTLEHLIDLGAPLEKIVMGLPFYGRTFITEVKMARFGDPSNDVGFPGPSTNENGFMGYNEICDTLKKNSNEWSVEWDAEASEALASKQEENGSKVVVYDTTRSLANKVRYAIRQNLGGLMVWSVDTDDFNGLCDGINDTFSDFEERDDIKLKIPNTIQGKYPLLQTINEAIVVSLDEVKQESLKTTTEVSDSTTQTDKEGGASTIYIGLTLSILSIFVNILL